MQKDQKQLEQQHLNTVLGTIKDAKHTLEKMMSSMGTDTLQQLKDFRDSPDSSDFYMFLDQLDQKNSAFNYKDKFKRLEELEYLINKNIINGAMNKLSYYNLINNVDDCNITYVNSNKKIYKKSREKRIR